MTRSLLSFLFVAATIVPASAATPDDVKCDQFRHEADGSWTSLPGARVDGTTLSDVRGIRPHSLAIRGVDLGAVLESKCGAE